MQITLTSRDIQCSLGRAPSFAMTCSVSMDGQLLDRLDTTVHGHTVVSRFSQRVVVTDTIQVHGSLVLVHRSWSFQRPGSYRLFNNFSYDDAQQPNTVLVPAVWYNDNEQGIGMYPTRARSEFWSFLEHRMPIPGCIQLSNGERIFTVSTDPATDSACYASSSWDTHGIRIAIPGTEWPCSYHGKQALDDTTDQEVPTIAISGPLQLHRTFYVQCTSCPDRLAAYRTYVEQLRQILPAQGEPLISWDAYRTSKIVHLISMVRRADNGDGYLQMGRGNGVTQPVYEFTAASFLVKSLEGACILASTPVQEVPAASLQYLSELLGLPNDCDLLLEVAVRIANFFLKAESEPGVFRDCHDLHKHIFGGYLGIGEHQEFQYLVNSRCNGEAMKGYVQLCSILKEHDRPYHSYLDLAQRVAMFYCDNQLSTGSFGRWWSPSGMPVNTQGTNGAYIGSFLIALYRFLPENDPMRGTLLSAIMRCYAYYGELANEGEFHGDTLDADSCDKEAGVALLSLFLDLYDLLPDQRYLASARRAADFILLWIWQTDQVFPAGTQLAKHGFHTMGMTAVSVAHHHLDFYGMTIAYDFLRLYAATGERIYEQQAHLMANACRQLIADANDALGRDASFIGWQPEQINHTNWDYFDEATRFCGSFDIDIAWVNVLGLGAYMKIKERFARFME